MAETVKITVEYQGAEREYEGEVLIFALASKGPRDLLTPVVGLRGGGDAEHAFLWTALTRAVLSQVPGLPEAAELIDEQAPEPEHFLVDHSHGEPEEA